MEKLKYPIGKYDCPQSFTFAQIRDWIQDIEVFPSLFRKEVESLTEAQLNTPYRPEGWTCRQVIHHVPDSHIQAFGRFKLALTEDFPTIKPYFEDRWAKLPDTALTPIGLSLDLLDALHAKWTILLKSMQENDFTSRGYVHPEYGKKFTLGTVAALYAWHGKHHLTHLKLVSGH